MEKLNIKIEEHIKKMNIKFKDTWRNQILNLGENMKKFTIFI